MLTHEDSHPELLKTHGVETLPVSVESSQWQHTAQTGTEKPWLRLGLRLIHGLSEDSAQRILAARQQAAFQDINDCRLRATDSARMEVVTVAVPPLWSKAKSKRR